LYVVGAIVKDTVHVFGASRKGLVGSLANENPGRVALAVSIQKWHGWN